MDIYCTKFIQIVWKCRKYRWNFIYAFQEIMPFTVPIFPELTFGWQLLVNNSFTAKQYSHRLPVTDRWTDMVSTRYSCALHEEFVKCNFNTDNTVISYLFTYYFCRYKWKISTSCCCFLMFQTHLMLAHRCYFSLIYCFFLPQSLQKWWIQVSLYMSRRKEKWGRCYQWAIKVKFKPQYCLSNEGTWHHPTSLVKSVGSMKFWSPTPTIICLMTQQMSSRKF